MKTISLSLILMLLLLFSGCYGYVPIEKVEINMGIGFDIVEKDGKVMFSQPTEILLFRGNKTFESRIITGIGESTYMAPEQKKSQAAKKYLIGPDRLYLISEKRARYGLEDFCDFTGRDTVRNLNAYIAISKQSPEEMFSTRFTEYDSVSQQITGIIQTIQFEYFFSNKFTAIEFLIECIESGREIYLPYLEIVKDKIKLTGAALFHGKKLIKIIPLEEARLINLIRYNKVINGKNNGNLNLTTSDPLKSVDFDCSSRSKVNVTKIDHKLKYDVTVNINATIKAYTLDKNDVLGDEDTKRLGKMLEKKMEKELNNEVNKVQTNYGFDCLDLTKYALAKLGRDHGYESDEYFQNAVIHVDVKVSVLSPGAISN